jgi:lactoylglutathione lyase
MTELPAVMSSLSLLVIKTPQVDRLREFYGMLGIAFTEEQHGNGPQHLAARLGTIVFENYPLGEGELPEQSTRLGFNVINLDATLDRLTAGGFSMVAPAKHTQWGYRAVVRDPDGRAIELAEV